MKIKNRITLAKRVSVHFCFPIFFIFYFTTPAKSQISYNDLMDLNRICKKEDFTAVKNFLENQNMKIEEFNTNYDHGSYFVLAHIKATDESGEYPNNIIQIDYNEYNDYKTLRVFQAINTNDLITLSSYRAEPLYDWVNQKWTNVVSSKPRGNSYQYEEGLGILGSFFWTDTTARQITLADLDQFLTREDLLNNKEWYKIYFLNNNPLLGELRYYELNFLKLVSYAFTLNLQTRFVKRTNITKPDNKMISIPLTKNGKLNTLNLKFGNILKTYIFDSGASDMSIDNETYQYFENSGQLKIENRLSDAEYQLADGTIVRFKRVKIPQFTINDIVIKNIESTVIENGKPLLLGKSFLDNFKSWKIDNENNKLTVELY
jgi:hypothetical protein